MNNENSSTTKRRFAIDQSAKIVEDKNLKDIFDFVEHDRWKDLGYDSLKACTDENLKLPDHTTMRRNHKVVDFQRAFLPDTEIGDFKRTVLQPVIEGNLSDKIKIRVAQQIMNSQKEFRDLSKKDIETFIKKSVTVLNQKHKDAALDIASRIVTDKLLDDIQDYIEESNLSEIKHNAFFVEIARQVRSELKNSL